MTYKAHKAHPWHGITIGPNAPNIVTAFIEIVPTDTVKYEIDKESGYLKIDRPQKFSNLVPALYGFIPMTFCGENIAEYCRKNTTSTVLRGDGDPLDICILCEKTITHGDILCQAIPIGGLRMIDKNEADDKIIAVLKNDPVYGGYQDITDCPLPVLERLRHYFLTYKNIPDAETQSIVSIDAVYGKHEAHQIIMASQKDYEILIKKADTSL
jgi:inorganic pyrophosphatase